jgi:hypothetical protein
VVSYIVTGSFCCVTGSYVVEFQVVSVVVLQAVMWLSYR